MIIVDFGHLREALARSVVWFRSPTLHAVWWGTLRARRGPGWLSATVAKQVRVARKKGVLPRRSLRYALAAPNRAAIPIVLAAVAGSAVLSWLLPDWHLRFLGAVAAGARLNVFTTMWQVQAGVAAIALPILLFVVESARDQQRAALPTGEVLIRESAALPIIAFSFFVTIRIGIDLTWFRSRTGVFLVDVGLTATTIVLALYAYQAVLRLNFSPARLRSSSIALVEEKMRGGTSALSQDPTGQQPSCFGDSRSRRVLLALRNQTS